MSGQRGVRQRLNGKPSLLIGEWEIDRTGGQICRDGEVRRLRPKTMDVLLCLANCPGDVVERDDIISTVWGRQLINDEPLTTCIAELRRTLDDQRSQPDYIQTVPKRGYRLVASVANESSAAGVTGSAPTQADSGSLPRYGVWAIALALIATATLWGVLRFQSDAPTDGGQVEGPPAIVVLPFMNIGPDEAYDYVGQGVAEEILNSLARLDGMIVRSRTSSFAPRNQNLDAALLADRLNVSHILEGSVRKSGDTLRISAQLIDVTTDARIWSDVFEKNIEDIYEFQGDIATQVTAALEIVLDLDQRRQLDDAGTTNPQAYDLYLRGIQLLPRRTAASIEQAARNFSRAIELDPQFAHVYKGLADASLLLPLYNDTPSAEYLDTALEAVNTALRLDPGFGEAYATLGAVLNAKHDYSGAEEAFQLALQNAPNYPTTYHWYGSFLYDMVRHEEADEMLTVALGEDPLSQLQAYGQSAQNLAALGRVDEAKARFLQITDADPQHPWAYEGLGQIRWNIDAELEEAAELYKQAIRYDPDSSYHRALLGAIYLDLGRPADAATWIAEARRISPDSLLALTQEALLNVYVGEPERARSASLEILAQDPRHVIALSIAGHYLLADDDAEEAKSLYERGYPELFNSDVQLDVHTFQAAVDLAGILRQLGEDEQADVLLERSWPLAATYPRALLQYQLSDVKILSQQGRTDEALSLLEAAVDGGWRVHWWYFLNHDAALEVLHGNPRFAAIVANLSSN